jgi:hypothetical protein
MYRSVGGRTIASDKAALPIIVSANSETRGRNEFLWPVAGIVLGALVGVNDFYRPHVTLGVGVAAWFLAIALVLILSAGAMTARIGVVVAGLFLAVPCFLRESPLSRGLLMCSMALPFAIVALPLSAPSTSGFRSRLVYFFTWLGTHEAKRRARSFDAGSLARLVGATAVLAAAMICVKTVPAVGLWLLARWLAGGIMILAAAEMVTAGHDFLTASMGLAAAGLMRSPHRSTSVAEFWAKRWNPVASTLVFRKFCFDPLARFGVARALFAAFLASAIGHLLLTYMASGRWGIALMCGAFFIVQPLVIAIERRLNMRRWRPSAGRAWTLTALMITSPLLVEPVLQLVEPSWGPPDSVLLPTVAVLSYVMIVNVFFSVGFLLFGSELRQEPKVTPCRSSM